MSERVGTTGGRFAAADGVSLRWVGWEPVGREHCALVIVHGLSDHADRYATFARRLARSGIGSFALDLRGHGESAGPRGHAPSFARLLDDLDRFRALVADRVASGCPIFLFGHSMGGLLALRYLQTAGQGVRAGILSAPWLATSSPVPVWKRVPAALLEHILPWLPVPAGIDAAGISDDADAVHAYESDPLVHGRISPRLFREVGRAASRALEETHLNVPAVLFLLPEEDPIVDAGTTRRMAARLEAVDVTVREWPTVCHELLSSTKQTDVADAVCGWILARAGP